MVWLRILIGTSLPLIQPALEITGLGWKGWTLAIAVSCAATFWMELLRILGKTV